MIITVHDRDTVKVPERYLQQKREDNPSFKVGLTSGCYDLFHFYHVLYLERCRRLCDFLIVGIDSDRLVKETKGEKRPVFGEFHRLRIVEALKHVDIAFIMDNLGDFYNVSEKMKVDKIFKNQTFKSEEVIGRIDAEIVTIPDVEELTSTSEFIKKIIQGAIGA